MIGKLQWRKVTPSVLVQFRTVHNSHLNKILKNRFKDPFRDKYLDNIYNNEIDSNSINREVKTKKIDYLRNFLYDQEEGSNLLLGDDIFDELKKKKNARNNNNEDQSKHSLHENKETKEGEEMNESKYRQAIRLYSLLKMNEKENIFDDDVFMNIDSKINYDVHQFGRKKTLHEEAENEDTNNVVSPERNKKETNEINTTDEFFNITNLNLPIFNPNAFCLALESLTNHICDDLIFLLDGIIDEKKIPKKEENNRLYKLILYLSDFVCLEKNKHDVDRWMNDVYSKIKNYLPESFKNLKDTYVSSWLKEHIQRVRENQKIENERLLHEKYYQLGLDFAYDYFPFDNENKNKQINDWKNEPIDKKKEFATDKCTLYFKTIIEFFLGKQIHPNLEEQLNLLFLNLKKIGLEHWLDMDVTDFEKYLLRSSNNNYLSIQEKDKYVAWLMLKCASRNITDFFFFDEFSPFHFFQKKPNKSIEEKINSIIENKVLPDEELKQMIFNDISTVTIMDKDQTFFDENNDMDIDRFIEKEKNFHMNRSLITYTFNEQTNSYQYKYRQISNTIYDTNTNRYIREKENIDPMLKLNEMRSSILEVKRMMSMTKDGRVYYIRIIVVIGNGKGVYGYGVGFGRNIKEARNSALLNSIKNIDFLDYNYKNCILNFPVIGQEYSAQVKIIPRPVGRGLKMNRKYLPLGYILGLENCKISFSGSTKWMSRIKALKRCLDKIMSIKTLCKMTGKKYVCHFAPHYFTSHWPDYWFRNILRDYEYKIQNIKKKRYRVCKNNFRSNIAKIPEEVIPDFTPYSWKSPLLKHTEALKMKKYIDTNVYHTNIF